MSFAYASPYDGYSRTPLRVGLAVISGVLFLGGLQSVASKVQDPHYARVLGPLHLLPDHPASAGVLSICIVIGLVFFALDRHSLLAGIWSLFWMSVTSFWQREVFGSPSRNLFFPGAMLFGWVLGLVWARVLAGKDADAPEGRVFRERLAEAGAMAGIAAAYTSSALSKLFAAGFDWINPHQIRWLILQQQPLGTWSWLSAYRNFVLESPRAAWLAALMTIVIEGSAFFLLFGSRWRLVWTAMIWALHCNIILLCVMVYVEPMALLLLFSVPWPRLFQRKPIEDPLLMRRPELLNTDMPDAMWIVLTVVVVLSWVLPIGWNTG